MQSRKPAEMREPTQASPLRAQWILGSGLLLLGALLILLGLLAELNGRLPFFMPRGWYASRPLWYFLAIASFVGGGFMMKHRPKWGGTWTAERPGVRFRQVIVYTRSNCKLCDTAKETLREHAAYLPAFHEVAIESEPLLLERFGTCVPVVEIDGRIRFRGRLNEVLLRRLIEGTPPIDAVRRSSAIARAR